MCFFCLSVCFSVEHFLLNAFFFILYENISKSWRTLSGMDKGKTVFFCPDVSWKDTSYSPHLWAKSRVWVFNENFVLTRDKSKSKALQSALHVLLLASQLHSPWVLKKLTLTVGQGTDALLPTLKTAPVLSHLLFNRLTMPFLREIK